MSQLEKGKFFGAVTVGERGQIVIPASLRKSFKIKARDKLIVFAKPNMIGVVPVEEFSQFLNHMTAAFDQIKGKIN